ncbi:hypothetical protein PFISCL1PPCAC_17868, partial [Pristionchus fissidentatus]
TKMRKKTQLVPLFISILCVESDCYRDIREGVLQFHGRPPLAAEVAAAAAAVAQPDAAAAQPDAALAPALHNVALIFSTQSRSSLNLGARDVPVNGELPESSNIFRQSNHYQINQPISVDFEVAEGKCRKTR